MASTHSLLRRSSSRLLALALVAAGTTAVASAQNSVFYWAGGPSHTWSAGWNGSKGLVEDPNWNQIWARLFFGVKANGEVEHDDDGYAYNNVDNRLKMDSIFFYHQAWTSDGESLLFNLPNGGANRIVVTPSCPTLLLNNDIEIESRLFSTTELNLEVQNANSIMRVTGLIRGDGKVRKKGAGKLILDREHTNSYGLFIDEGLVVDRVPLGTYYNESTLAFEVDADKTRTAYVDVKGGGAFVKTGGGSLILNSYAFPSIDANEYYGLTVVSDGFLYVDRPSLSSSYTVVNGGRLIFQPIEDRTYVNPITVVDDGGFYKLGTKTMTLTNPTNNMKFAQVREGRLIEVNPAGSGRRDILAGAALQFDVTPNANSTESEYAGVISGAGTFTKSGAGTLYLSGANTYTGETVVRGGRLIAAQPRADYALTTAGSALEFRTGGTRTFAGRIGGSGSFTKSGDGTLTLTGANDYTGGTTVNAGRLIETNPHGRYVTNADLEFKPTGLVGSTGAISGSGSFTVSQGGYNMYHPNTYAGATTVSGGGLAGYVTDALPTGTALTVNADASYLIGTGTSQTIASLSGAGTVLGARNSTLTVAGAANTEFSGTIGGDGAFVKSGSGTLFLSGLSAFETGTTVNGGRLVVATPYADYTNRAALEFRTATDRSYAGVVSGTGRLTKSGAGTLTLASKSTYTGGTTVSAGRLVDIAPHGDYVNNAELEFRTNGFQEYAGSVSGTGSLVKSGADTLTLNGTYTYGGATYVDAGTLRLGRDGTLPSARKVEVASGATLDLAGHVQALDAVQGRGTVDLQGSGRLQVVGAGSEFAGRITGGGSFTKTGAGTMTLSGTSDYSGGTRVQNAGTLRVTGAIRGDLDVASGATFDNAAAGGLVLGSAVLQGNVRTTTLTRFTRAVTGAGNFTGDGAVRFDGGYSPGNSPGNSPAAIDFAGDLAFGPQNVLTMELGGLALGTGYDHLTVRDDAILGGSLNVVALSGFTLAAGQSFDLFDFRRSSGTFSSVNLPSLSNGLAWDTSSLYTSGVIRTTQAVPEPATFAALGLGALALLKRRRKNG